MKELSINEFVLKGKQRFVWALVLGVVISCGKEVRPALLPLPKQVEYTGGSVKASLPVSEKFVEAIPEATLNENEAYRLTVSKDGITLEATTGHGLWNGRQPPGEVDVHLRLDKP